MLVSPTAPSSYWSESTPITHTFALASFVLRSFASANTPLPAAPAAWENNIYA